MYAYAHMLSRAYLRFIAKLCDELIENDYNYCRIDRRNREQGSKSEGAIRIQQVSTRQTRAADRNPRNPGGRRISGSFGENCLESLPPLYHHRDTMEIDTEALKFDGIGRSTSAKSSTGSLAVVE